MVKPTSAPSFSPSHCHGRRACKREAAQRGRAAGWSPRRSNSQRPWRPRQTPVFVCDQSAGCIRRRQAHHDGCKDRDAVRAQRDSSAALRPERGPPTRARPSKGTTCRHWPSSLASSDRIPCQRGRWSRPCGQTAAHRRRASKSGAPARLRAHRGAAWRSRP